MTKAEAIKELKMMLTDNSNTGAMYNALKLAIEALRETDMGLNNGDHLHPFGEPFGWTEEEIQKHGLRELLKEVDNRNDELSCSEKPNRSDTIYRQDAIYYVKQATIGETDVMKAWVKAQTHLMRLPSAQPERECESGAEMRGEDK